LSLSAASVIFKSQ